VWYSYKINRVEYPLMNASNERPNRIPWPPLLLAVALVAAIALQAFYPLRFGRGEAGEILRGAGIVALLAAIGLIALAVAELRKANTTVMAHRAAGHLVTSGPYALSRNPIYLGMAIALIGLGLVTGNVWLILASFICGYAQQKLAIEREEAHLQHRFGKAWRDYRKRVRRWI
jgi:protein-S-isoprenylcysteine O-methyltransferase Ste14